MNDFAEIELSTGHTMKVDVADAPLFTAHRWRGVPSFPTGKLYARRNRKLDGKWICFWAHRILFDLGPDEYVDHINGDTLDNRRANLRKCSKSENNRAARMRHDNTSGFKGVVWYAPTKRWKAQIGLDGKRLGLGYFLDINDAARAYDAAAEKHHGAFAITNASLGLLS